MLIIIFMIIAGTSFSQVVVTHFNAEWNNPNKAEWVGDLTDCEVTYIDISSSPKLQKKHKVVVVPTIIIFKDGEEMKRYQADVSFKMVATWEELQEDIEELLAEDY